MGCKGREFESRHADHTDDGLQSTRLQAVLHCLRGRDPRCGTGKVTRMRLPCWDAVSSRLMLAWCRLATSRTIASPSPEPEDVASALRKKGSNTLSRSPAAIPSAPIRPEGAAAARPARSAPSHGRRTAVADSCRSGCPAARAASSASPGSAGSISKSSSVLCLSAKSSQVTPHPRAVRSGRAATVIDRWVRGDERASTSICWVQWARLATAPWDAVQPLAHRRAAASRAASSSWSGSRCCSWCAALERSACSALDFAMRSSRLFIAPTKGWISPGTRSTGIGVRSAVFLRRSIARPIAAAAPPGAAPHQPDHHQARAAGWATNACSRICVAALPAGAASA